jgi:hypothetical protein
MPERNFVIANTLEPAIREGSWLCKRPSDQGPWVFINLKTEPRNHHCYVIEITSLSRNGNSRQGKVAFVAEDVLKELMAALTHATWFRDRNGDPWARGIKSSTGVFDAYLVPAAYTTSFGAIPARIIFEPAEGSPVRVLKNELANWLETDAETEIARAEASPFGPGVTPASGKAQMIAEMLERRSTQPTS